LGIVEDTISIGETIFTGEAKVIRAQGPGQKVVAKIIRINSPFSSS